MLGLGHLPIFTRSQSSTSCTRASLESVHSGGQPEGSPQTEGQHEGSSISAGKRPVRSAGQRAVRRQSQQEGSISAGKRPGEHKGRAPRRPARGQHRSNAQRQHCIHQKASIHRSTAASLHGGDRALHFVLALLSCGHTEQHGGDKALLLVLALRP